MASVFATARNRVLWLAGLMMLQSLSSFVLKQYSDFLKDNLIVTYFLTMLIGMGGNCGAEASSHLIQALAKGKGKSVVRTMMGELATGALMAAVLMLFALLRVLLFNPESTWRQAAGITLSLGLIVIISTALGAALPFLMHRLHLNVAHAGSTVQVLMDLLGVTITCVLCFALIGRESSEI